MIKKMKLVVSYDGTDFHGFQKQGSLRTIQNTLEKVLSKVTEERIQIFGSGRTDAGVHALGQVCHFSTKSTIPTEKYPFIVNMRLPKDLLIRSCQEVDEDFDAQKNACWKTYRYELDTNKLPDLFHRRFRMHFRLPLETSLMREASKLFIGTHDFSSFCSSKTLVTDKVRTLYDIQILEKPGILSMDFTGNGFLYNMVRILVGTLVKIGRRKILIKDIPTMLSTQNRSMAGPTFPPEGLILKEVGYHPWESHVDGQ